MFGKDLHAAIAPTSFVRGVLCFVFWLFCVWRPCRCRIGTYHLVSTIPGDNGPAPEQGLFTDYRFPFALLSFLSRVGSERSSICSCACACWSLYSLVMTGA